MILVHCKFQGRMVFVVVSLFHCFVFFGGEVARAEGNRQVCKMTGIVVHDVKFTRNQ